MHGKDITLQHVLRAVYCIDLLWTLYPAKSLLEVLSHLHGFKGITVPQPTIQDFVLAVMATAQSYMREGFETYITESDVHCDHLD
eukprot:757191-Hanusia_phi.AAC.1